VFAAQFLKQSLQEQPAFLYEQNGRIYAMQQPFLKLKDIRILRQGCQVGEIVKNRLEPHQHFYVSNAYGAGITQRYTMDDTQCLSFLQG
ncbi:RsmF rRNA methyltransferase first C-terminal domain-containing protein, partial [Erysipelatoclostridium ramosum]